MSKFSFDFGARLIKSWDIFQESRNNYRIYIKFYDAEEHAGDLEMELIIHKKHLNVFEALLEYAKNEPEKLWEYMW